MELYYHMTDGGAEYYSTKHVDGSTEGSIDGVIMRTDGGEIEIFADSIKAQGLRLVITGGDYTQEQAAALDAIRAAKTDAEQIKAFIAAFDLIAPERQPYILALMEAAGVSTDFIGGSNF